MTQLIAPGMPGPSLSRAACDRLDAVLRPLIDADDEKMKREALEQVLVHGRCRSNVLFILGAKATTHADRADLTAEDRLHDRRRGRAGIHEVLPDLHRNNAALHPNKFNQGVTPEMRERDRRLHWWYRAREQGADELLPGWVYDK